MGKMRGEETSDGGSMGARGRPATGYRSRLRNATSAAATPATSAGESSDGSEAEDEDEDEEEDAEEEVRTDAITGANQPCSRECSRPYGEYRTLTVQSSDDGVAQRVGL